MDPIPPAVFDAARLAAVRATGLMDTAPEAVFDDLARLAASLLEAPYAFVTLVDEERSFWKSCIGVDVASAGQRQLSVEESFCRYVIEDSKPLIVGDARRDARTRDNPSIARLGVVAWAGFPMRDAAGRVLGTFCVVDTVVRDWTTRQIAVLEALAGAAAGELRLRASLAGAEAERDALAESEARFRSLADAAPVMIYVSDANGACAYLSEGWLRYTGLQLEAGLGRGWIETVHPDDRGEVLAVHRSAFARRAPFEAHYRLRRAGGDYGWVIDRGTPRLTPSGRFTGYVGTLLDVTSLRDAQALAEQRFRSLAEAAPVMIWMTDATGRADYFNGGWLRFRGRTAEEERGDGWLEGLHPDDLPGYLEQWRVALTRRRPCEMTVRVCDARGRHRWVIDSVSPRHTADGEYAGLVGSRVDISEQVEAKEAERRRAEQLAKVASAAVVINSARSLTERLEAVTEQAADVIGAHQAVTSFTVDGDWGQAITAVHLSERYAAYRDYLAAPDGSGLYAVVCETNRPMRLTQAELVAHPRWRGFGAEAERHPPMNGWLAAPLVGRDGANIGLIQLSDRRGGDFTAEDESILVQMAQMASLAVDNARLHEEEQAARRAAERARARTARLQRITASLAGALTVADVAEITVQEGMDALEAHMGLLVMRHGDSAETVRAVGYPPQQLEPLRRFDVGAPWPIAEVMRTRAPLWLESRDDWHANGFGEPRMPAASAVAPLVSQGEVLGAVAFRFEAAERALSMAERIFLVTLAGQCAQALDRARLHQAEHELAETLQRSLLPERLATSPRMRFAVRYQSSSLPGEVGGDWYEAIQLPGGRIGLSIGDVVGRGPAAAAVMGQLRSALAAIALTASGPAEALDRLGGFAAQLSGAFLTTVAYAELSPDTGELRYACAGHPPPVLADGRGGAELLWGGRGAPLGARKRAYVEDRRTLAPGQTLVLYTDGLVERRDRTLDARLDQLVSMVAVAGDRAELDRLADDVVSEMSDGGGTEDDAALLLARLGPAPVSISVPARPEALAPLRRNLRDWLEAWGAGPVAAVDLPLALGEAAANAVEHAYADRKEGLVTVELSSGTDGAFHLRVSDSGRWQRVPASGDRGRGLPLMRRIMDEVHIDARDEGTTIAMRWRPRNGATRAPDAPAARPLASAPVDGGLAGIEVERHDGTVVARLDGEVDLSNAGHLGRRLRPLARSGERVVIDLSRVRYLDSTGLQMLAELEDASHGPRVELVVSAEGPVGDLLRLAGYEELFTITSSRGTALP